MTPVPERQGYAEHELPAVLGISRRSAARIARVLGHKVGSRRIVLAADLLDWITSQPSTPALPTGPGRGGGAGLPLR